MAELSPEARAFAMAIEAGEFVEVWVCDPPALGVKYRVLRSEWIQDYTVRLIHEIQVVE